MTCKKTDYEESKQTEPYSQSKMPELRTYMQYAVKRGHLGQGASMDQSYDRLLAAAKERLSALKTGFGKSIPKHLPEYKDWQAIVDIAKTYDGTISYESRYEQVSAAIEKITASIEPDLLSRKIEAEINRTKRVQFEDCAGE